MATENTTTTILDDAFTKCSETSEFMAVLKNLKISDDPQFASGYQLVIANAESSLSEAMQGILEAMGAKS